MKHLELRALAVLTDGLAYWRRRAPFAWSGAVQDGMHRLFLWANDRFMRRAQADPRADW